MTLQFTPNFRFGIPDFNSEPWHADFEALVRAIDTAIHDALVAAGADQWANSTVYAVAKIVISPDDGSMWVCAVAHTSPASPTTFASFRAANPTYWNAVANIPQQKGIWLTATSYIPGDFVVDNNRYAVCLVGHVSGVFNTDLGAGKWVVLVDLSNLGVGINTIAEASVASAATVNLGALSSTRVLITGSTGPIASFGNVANTFKIVRYQDTPTITNSAAIALVGNADRTMRAGDVSFLYSDAAFNWKEVTFFRLDGNPATTTEAGVIKIASNAEAAAGIITNKAVVPSAAKSGYLPGPSGTIGIFVQAAAPTGWTKNTTHNDKALRIVSGTGAGSGGTSAFSTVFGKTATDAYTLAIADTPAHTHGGATGNDSPVHTHSVSNGSNGTAFTAAATAGSGVPNSTSITSGNPSVNHTHSISSQGGGGSHSHPMDIRVQYVDGIICTKD